MLNVAVSLVLCRKENSSVICLDFTLNVTIDQWNDCTSIIGLLDVTSVICLTFTMLLPIIRNGDTVGFASNGIAFIPCCLSITVAVKRFKSWERETAL